MHNKCNAYQKNKKMFQDDFLSCREICELGIVHFHSIQKPIEYKKKAGKQKQPNSK